MSVFDCHLLLGRDHWIGENKPELAHALSLDQARGLFSTVAPDGRWHAAVFPFPSARDPSYQAENEAILAAAAAESRLLPVVAINPNDETSRVFLERVGSQVAGIVIWPILCNLDLRLLAEDEAFWAVVRSHDLPVTVHVGTGDEPRYRTAVQQNAYAPLDAIELAAAQPGVRFNLSHALRLSRGALALAARMENVWTDVSGYSSYGAWSEGGGQVFPAKDPIVGPAAYDDLLRTLETEFGMGGRVMFGSSEPFCRWWDFSLEREYTTYACNADRERGFHNAARTFYKNRCEI